MSNRLDMELKQGEDFYRLLTIKDANGDAVDITGYTFAAQIKKGYQDKSAFLTFSFNISDASAGQVEMTLAASLSSAKIILKREEYVYDVEMDDTVRKTRIMEGVIEISPEVTK